MKAGGILLVSLLLLSAAPQPAFAEGGGQGKSKPAADVKTNSAGKDLIVVAPQDLRNLRRVVTPQSNGSKSGGGGRTAGAKAGDGKLKASNAGGRTAGAAGKVSRILSPLNKSGGRRALAALKLSLARGNASNASIRARIASMERIKLKVAGRLNLTEAGGALAVGKRKLKVQPEDLESKRLKVEAAELRRDGERVIYKLRVKTRRKVLWLLPVETQEELSVDAESGEVKEYSRPWWSFLDTSGSVKKLKEKLRAKAGE